MHLISNRPGSVCKKKTRMIISLAFTFKCHICAILRPPHLLWVSCIHCYSDFVLCSHRFLHRSLTLEHKDPLFYKKFSNIVTFFPLNCPQLPSTAMASSSWRPQSRPTITHSAFASEPPAPTGFFFLPLARLSTSCWSSTLVACRWVHPWPQGMMGICIQAYMSAHTHTYGDTRAQVCAWQHVWLMFMTTTGKGYFIKLQHVDLHVLE